MTFHRKYFMGCDSSAWMRVPAHKTRLSVFVSLSFLLLFGSVDPCEVIAQAPSQNTVDEVIGYTTAQQAAAGLGFNIMSSGYTQEWQFAAAKAAGASWIRIQCSWSSVEQQTAAPVNLAATPQYVQTPGCVSALTYAKKYGLRVTIVAGYGPPVHEIMAVAIPGGAAMGSTSLSVTSALGPDNLTQLAFPYDYICPEKLNSSGGPLGQCAATLSAAHSYQGTLITSVSLTDTTHAVLGLASALTQDLPQIPSSISGCSITSGSLLLTCPEGGFSALQAGSTQVIVPGAGFRGQALVTAIGAVNSAQQVILEKSAATSVSNATISQIMLFGIQEILYPSTISFLPNDPSVRAYGNYVMFLANDMASRGVSGDVELWNEPPWHNDPWDNRCNLYDAALDPCPSFQNAQVGQMYANAANYGFPINLQDRSMPSGVTITWAGTNFSSNPSMLEDSVFMATGSRANQPATVVTTESTHPYGGPYGNPEESFATMACLQGDAIKGVSPFRDSGCFLPGERNAMEGGSNLFGGIYEDLTAKLIDPAYGIKTDITETNLGTTSSGQQLQQARFNVRQFLGFEAMGITPIEFFELWDGVNHVAGDSTLSFVNYDGTKMTPLPGYTALSGLLADLALINSSPVAPYTAATLPSVTSYNGSYVLSSVHMVGARSTSASGNSDLYAIWQRTVCQTEANCWVTLPSPTPASAAVQIPSGLKVTSVIDLVTRASILYTISGNQLSVDIADDPIEILTDPSGMTNQLFGTNLSLSASPNPTSYGSKVLLNAVLAPKTLEGHTTNGEVITFSAGGAVLGTGILSSGVASLALTSLPAGLSTLVATYAGDDHFAQASNAVQHAVTAAVPTLTLLPVATQTYGAAAFSVNATSKSPAPITYQAFGPATLAGNTVTLTGAGTVTLIASQPASANFARATAQATFTVLQRIPTLTFTAIPNQTFGATPFDVRVQTNSPATMSYAVVSGPATISSNRVTITGAGTVVLAASQPVAANFQAGHAQTTFVVKPAVPKMSFSIPTETYGAAPFQVHATSNAPGSIVYTVVSGPATISGNTVTLTGAGTVLLAANQSASANYIAGTVKTAFSAKQAVP